MRCLFLLCEVCPCGPPGGPGGTAWPSRLESRRGQALPVLIPDAQAPDTRRLGHTGQGPSHVAVLVGGALRLLCYSSAERLSISRGAGGGGDASEGKGPQRRPQQRLGRRLEEVAEAVGGGYCRLRMPLRLALAARAPNNPPPFPGECPSAIA